MLLAVGWVEGSRVVVTPIKATRGSVYLNKNNNLRQYTPCPIHGM